MSADREIYCPPTGITDDRPPGLLMTAHRDFYVTVDRLSPPGVVPAAEGQ